MWKNRHHVLSYLFDREVSSPPVFNAQLQRDRLAKAQNLFRTDFKAHYGCVNAIEFSNKGGEFFASGGDDTRVLLWNTESALSKMGEPVYMKGNHSSNIFCLAFDRDNEKIFSGGNDGQVIIHNIASGQTLDVFNHEDMVYGLSADPNNDNVFASACNDGRILIYDIREPASSEPFCLANYTSSMHSVMYNPVESRLLATANAKEGVGLWDVRKPRSCLLRFGGSLVQQSCMSVRVNADGSHLIALRRRLPPVLYNLTSPIPVCEFDHSGYYNSCTMKSCCFAGDKDQYVVSGSDDFNLYMWKIPDDLSTRQYINRTHMVLKGHRSIVNQVRFNPSNHLLISSGVEKVIKAWSPFIIPDSQGSLSKAPRSSGVDRPVYTHEEYINLVLRSGNILSHDYANQSIDEDPRMMAFFDSLVQRELEGWSSDDDLSSNEDELYERIVQLSRSEISMSGSDTDDDGSFSPFTLAFASVMAARTVEENAASGENILNLNGEIADMANDPSTISVSPAEIVLEGQRSTNSRRSMAELIEKKRKQTNMQDTSRTMQDSDSSNDSDADIGHSENKMSAQRQRAVMELKKLKDLRVMADRDTDSMQGIGEVSISKPCASTSHAKQSNDGAEHTNSVPATCTRENIIQTKEVVGKMDASKLSLSVTCGSSSVEMGPYLHEALSSNYDAMPATSGLNNNPKRDIADPGGAPCSDSNAFPNDTVCSSRVASGCVAGASSCDNVAGPSTKPGCSTEVPEMVNDNQNDQPVWTEFKRFKRRVERARRYYRQHSNKDRQSSDEDN